MKIWTRFESVDELSWVSHVLITLVMAPVVGTGCALWAYVVRELEQVWAMRRSGMAWADQPWVDHLCDVAIPAFVLGFVHIWLGW